jgi:DNA polymerase-3 subunit chi
MRLGFYLCGQQPVERVLPLIARAAMRSGERLLVVAGDEAQRKALADSLWAFSPEEFLANGMAGGPHDARQPILIGDACEAGNGATHLALADGEWRETAEAFARVFLFFTEEGRAQARSVWRRFDGRDDVEREFHELEGGKWVRKA